MRGGGGSPSLNPVGVDLPERVVDEPFVVFPGEIAPDSFDAIMTESSTACWRISETARSRSN